MKKLFFSFLFLIISIFSFGQTICSDKVDDNGIRIVESSCITARDFTDRVVWNFGLRAYQSSDTTIYCIIINLNAMSELNIKDNSILLIKTFNDDIIKLINIKVQHSEKVLGYRYNKPILGSIGTVSTNSVHSNIGYFYVSPDNINKFKNGISKVRLELEEGYTEKNYKKDKAGLKLYNSFNIINERLSQKYKSVEEDF